MRRVNLGISEQFTCNRSPRVGEGRAFNVIIPRLPDVRLLFLSALICTVMALTIHAQSYKTEQTKAWKQFQAAISRNDKTAVAALIEFPFEASIIGENSNFKVERRVDFIKIYDRIFTAARRAKIIRGKPVAGGGQDEFNFEMYENGSYHVFTFHKIGSTYKLVGTMAAG